jgi:hypothetical protein
VRAGDFVSTAVMCGNVSKKHDTSRAGRHHDEAPHGIPCGALSASMGLRGVEPLTSRLSGVHRSLVSAGER